MPHCRREDLQSDDEQKFDYVRCMMGWITYLTKLSWNSDGTVQLNSAGVSAPVDAYLIPLPSFRRSAMCTTVHRTPMQH